MTRASVSSETGGVYAPAATDLPYLLQPKLQKPQGTILLLSPLKKVKAVGIKTLHHKETDHETDPSSCVVRSFLPWRRRQGRRTGAGSPGESAFPVHRGW